MIKTDEWTERTTSTRRQLLRARVRRAALEEHYQRLVAARAASSGPDAAELLVSGEAAEEMAALEEELEDARKDLEAADARLKLLTQLLEKKPHAEEAAGFNPQGGKEEDPRVGL